MSLMGKLFGGNDDDKRKSRRTSIRKKASARKSEAGESRSSQRRTAKKPRSTVAVRPNQVARAVGGAGQNKGRPDDTDNSRRKRTSMKGKRIGALLLKKECISEEQLEAALSKQLEQGGLLGQILISEGICSKADIGAVLKKQRTITTVLLQNVAFEPTAIELLDREFCEKSRLIPFEKIGNHLCVAMANVLDTQAKNDMKEKTNLQIKTFDASWQDIQEAIAGQYEAVASAPEPTEEAAQAEATENADLVIELPDEDLIGSSEPLPDISSPIISSELEEPQTFDEVEEVEELNEEDLIEDIPDVHSQETVNEPAILADDEILEELPDGVEEVGEVVEDLAAIGIESEAPDEAEDAIIDFESDEGFAELGITEVAPVESIEPADLIEEVEPTVASTPAPVPVPEATTTGAPLPDGVLTAVPVSPGYFSEVVQWGTADPERRWLAEHLADNALPGLPETQMLDEAS